ncbi:MAG: hypothetical protein WD078_14780 [Woeseia sp.]
MRAMYQMGLAFLAGTALAACGEPVQDTGQTSAPRQQDTAAPSAAADTASQWLTDLKQALDGPARPQADRTRDAGRKPAQVMQFLGIEPGMDVIDIIAAGGYYTEVLSLAVGPEGSVVAQNPQAVLEFRDGANEKALSQRLADDRLPNVRRLNKDFQEMTAGDGPFDAAITALNFHDIYNGSGPDAAVSVLRKVHSVLKPGGVLGIIDHAGVAGADNASLHRIEKSKVIETAEAAGFVVEGDSDLLSNPDDDHTKGVFSEGLRGNTDRLLLKLRKPAGEESAG